MGGERGKTNGHGQQYGDYREWLEVGESMGG